MVAIGERTRWSSRSRISTTRRHCSAATLATYFTTPHYEGSSYVLVRLEAIDKDELAGLIEDAWRLTAPRRLVAGYDGGK